MPISRLLANIQLTPEQNHVLEIAFRHAILKLGLVDRSDPICVLVAKKMLDLHRQGVTDAIALTELTLREVSPRKSKAASVGDFFHSAHVDFSSWPIADEPGNVCVRTRTGLDAGLMRR